MIKILFYKPGSTLDKVRKQYGPTSKWLAEIYSNIAEIRTCRIDKGESADINKFDGLIVGGSSNSVYDKIDWIYRLQDILIEANHKKKYVLGICFGHQLIAQAFGGKVELNSKGWEVGSYKVYLTRKGKQSALFNKFNNNFVAYESHQDVVTVLPSNAKELAYNRMGNQSFKIKDNMFAVQFHPEFDSKIMHSYILRRKELGANIINERVFKTTKLKNVLTNFYYIIKRSL